MDHQSKLLKNIEGQIRRLLDQLKELEEEKEELEVEEYDEMKQETVDQLKIFQEKLDQFKGKDFQTDAEKTQQEIMKAVSSAYDQKALKGVMNEKKANEIREEIKKLIINSDDQGIIAKDILKLLTQIRDERCNLTEDETEFLKAFEGSDFESVSKEGMMLAFFSKFTK